jgi:cytochrome c-type biogenesis protein CcmH/NrfG
MYNTHKPIRLLAMLMVLAQPAWAAEDLMTSHLVSQARHWQAKDRDDLAAESWRSVLRSDSSHGEALVKLGLIEARAGNRPEAVLLLEQANRLNPKPRGLDALAALLPSEATKSGTTSTPTARQSDSKTEAAPKESKPKSTSPKKTTPASASDALSLKP